MPDCFLCYFQCGTREIKACPDDVAKCFAIKLWMIFFQTSIQGILIPIHPYWFAFKNNLGKKKKKMKENELTNENKLA